MADTKDSLAPFKAAKLAEYDAKSPPDELPFTQLKKLLVDGLPPDDGALLIQIFKDAVNEGDILPSQKTGTGFNWPNHIGAMTQIIKSKPLTDDEISQAETGGYPGANVTLWDYDGCGSLPLLDSIRPIHPWENERLPRHKPPAAKIEYYFSRDAIQGWFDTMSFNPSDLLKAWLNVGESKGADDSTNQKKQGQRKTKLTPPQKQDDWFDLINDAANEFYSEYQEMPKHSQLWGRLCNDPPHGYFVTTGTDRGEQCLFMDGCKPLALSAFRKRWKSYTENKTE